MLGLFKVNDPYRLAFVLAMLLLIRLPILWGGVPLIIPELKWMLIGERLGQGGIVYRDLWDHVGPFSAMVFSWLNDWFGRSDTPFKVLSIVLVFIQASVFNFLLLKNKAYNQNTYVPAFIYVLMMNLSFDFFTLSPALMGTTFILLAINNLFKRMDNTTRDDLFVHTGIYLAVATLFFQPFFLYFLVTILSLLLFTGSIIRRMLLLVYGYFLTIGLVAIYYLWHDSWHMFMIGFIKSVFTLEAYRYVAVSDFLLICAVPFVLFIVAFFKMYQLGRFINYQIKIQRVMLFFVISGVLAMLMVKEFSAFQLIYFVPGMAFFMAHYLLAIRKWYLAELHTILVVVLVLLNVLFPLRAWLYVDRFVSFDDLKVKSVQMQELIEGKKLWVIGDDVNLYQQSALATPYLNWQLSEKQLSQVDFYDNLTQIYIHISSDLPEVIVDEKNIVSRLFDKMPSLASKYKQSEAYAHVYLLMPSSN